MNKFNKIITIEVSVDSIAEQLLSNISPDFKHRELLTETIIGQALTSDKLGYVYNALNGFTNDIDFKVGDVVICEETAWKYERSNGGVDEAPKYKQERRTVGQCKVIEINPYSAQKVKVEWTTINSQGNPSTDYAWVSHTKCAKIPVE